MSECIVKSYKVNKDTFYKCGIFAINKNSLKKKKLSCKYWKNLNCLQSYPVISRVKPISSECVDFLTDCFINGNKFDMSKFFNLNDDEQKTIIYLFDKSKFGLEIGFNFGESYKSRFKVIQGEIMTGNNNPELFKEGKFLVKKLMDFHIIPFSQGEEMIEELNNL